MGEAMRMLASAPVKGWSNTYLGLLKLDGHLPAPQGRGVGEGDHNMNVKHPAVELGDRVVFVWRLTLTCGHPKLWGPFLDGTYEKLVGDRTTCEICPQVKQGPIRVWQVHLVVNAEPVNPYMCSPDWLRAGLEGVIE